MSPWIVTSLAGATGAAFAYAFLASGFSLSRHEPDKDAGLVDRIPFARPVVDLLSPLFARHMADTVARIDRVLVLAGDPFGGITGAQYLALTAFGMLYPVFMAGFALAMGFSLKMTGLLALMALVLVGTFSWWSLDRVYKKRMRALDIEFPYFLDFTVMSKEAGATLQQAIDLFVTSSPDTELGRSLAGVLNAAFGSGGLLGALKDFSDTCPSPNGRTTLQAILKAEPMGAESGTLLREIARDLRARRFEAAEKAAEMLKGRIMVPTMLMFVGAFLMILAGSFAKLFGV